MEIIALGIVLLIVAGIVGPGIWLGIGPMPSSRGARQAVVGLLAQVPEQAVIYEVGSGWGGLARRIAKAYPNRQVIGIEASLIPFAVSVLRAYLHPVGKLRLRFGRFSVAQVAAPCVLVCYLHPQAMVRLAEWLKGQPVDTVISVGFSLPDRSARQTIGQTRLRDGPVRLYRIASTTE